MSTPGTSELEERMVFKQQQEKLRRQDALEAGSTPDPGIVQNSE